MQMKEIESVYFVGAGGIGMSALVRYFLTKGYNVGGYDKTPSDLTEKLIEEQDYYMILKHLILLMIHFN